MTVGMNLITLVSCTGVAMISIGCGTLGPQNQSTQIVSSAENVIEIQCGERTIEVQADKLTSEQKEELEQLKTRCRIDAVADKLELRSGFVVKTLDDSLNNRELHRVDKKVGRN